MMRDTPNAIRQLKGSPSKSDFSTRIKVRLVRFGVALLFTSLILTTVLCSFSTLASAGDPSVDTFFEYEYVQWVDSCSGIYEGYTERTEAKGKYDVISWGPDEVSMTVVRSWTYSNNEGERDSGRFEGDFSFSLATRKYTSPEIDLDDPLYTSQPASTLSQWLWIPPGIGQGESISILDQNWTVTKKDATLWSKWIPRKVTEVTVRGSYFRDDDYGDFDYTYTDRLYYEKDSGMFFAERYEEWDEGLWHNQWAKFRYVIEIDVVRSSYDVEIDWLTMIFTYTSIAFLTIAISWGIGYMIYRGRWRTRKHDISLFVKDSSGYVALTKEKIVFRRVWKMKDYPHLDNNATDNFEPFLEHWTEKALLAKDRVAVAVSERYGLVGFALYNKEAKIGTILCKNTETTETLRSFVGCKDFFSEERHLIKPTKEMRKDRTLMKELKKVRNEAYNVFETHSVYELSTLEPVSYDTKLVRPIRTEDLPQVTALAKKIFRGRAKRWMAACVNSGDLGYVAVADGLIVGFGFACVSGSHGRLHTLGVAKEYRGRGIGKELHLARLEAMRLMGVTRVIDEIADWNLASKRISTLSGFKRIGDMYVETTRTKRIKKNIIRR